MNFKNVLENYKRKTTNLSTTNKSLFHYKLNVDQDIDIHEFDFLNLKPSFHIIQKLIAKNDVELLPIADARNEHSNKLSKRIKKVLNKQKFLKEERGTENLFVGYPYIRGKFLDGTVVSCPLLFFPIQMAPYNNTWQINLRDKAELNTSFFLAYSHFQEIYLSTEILNTDFDEFSGETKVFLTQLYDLLKQNNIAINFNRSLFEEKLQAFSSFTRKQFEEEHANGVLKLYPEAIIGIFPPSGSAFEQEYRNLIDNLPYHTLEEFFIEKTSPTPKEIKEENAYYPCELDASQEKALNIIKSGQSLVVQGPPGTGKSELIANVMADSMANGKSVLLVCDKKVALDVVYQRLSNYQLQNHIALIHDFKADKKDLFKKLNDTIQDLEQIIEQNNQLSTVILERNYLQISKQIKIICEQLENFKNALFDQSLAGISIKELYFLSNLNKPYFEIDKNLLITPEEAVAFKHTLKLWLLGAKFGYNLKHLWFERKSFHLFGLGDLPILIEQVLKISDCYKLANNQQFTEVKDINQINIWTKNTEIFNKLIACLQSNNDYTLLKMHAFKKHKKRIFEKLSFKWKETYALPYEKYSTKPQDLLQIIDNKLLSLNNDFKAIIWQYFSKKDKELEKILKDNGLKVNKSSLLKLNNLLQQRIERDQILNELKQFGLSEPPIEEEKLTEWISNYWHLFNLMESLISLSEEEQVMLKNWLKTNQLDSFNLKINEWISFCEKTYSTYSEASSYLHESQIAKLISQEYLVDSIKSIEQDFEKIIDFDKLKHSLPSKLNQLAELTYKQTGDKNLDESIETFFNSLYTNWIFIIEKKYPELNICSSEKINFLESELQELVSQKKMLAKEIVLLKTLEKTHKDLKFNRLNNRITYRDLLHELNKKRRTLSIRQLLEKHKEELFQICPCWLASPETTVSVFPQEAIFDLIIFDEASQCFVEEAFPALSRAKQLLIVGDSKQLKPNNIYKSKWEDENDIADIQVESMLELAGRYLPQTMLLNHYRSKYIALIKFSNQHFYRDKLTLIPHADHLQNEQKAVQFILCPGIWNNGVNAKEAELAVEHVFEIHTKQPQKSIGVICINYTQQNYVEELLETYITEKKLSAPEKLFIKNIENVQGDESDIIILSITYAPNLKGQINSNFGSLSQEGGENRLNVAITRAKEKLLVLCSFLPNQLQVSDAINEGPKLLKQFLQYAYDQNNSSDPFNNESKNAGSHSLAKRLATIDHVANYNFADLVNEKTGQIILTDDEIFYSALSIKESFAYKPIQLQKKNWTYQWQFSRNFWLKP